ncbi:CheR family methyltransferase [Alicyclobacillus herbarius]|uniref:CheR family methyltransferase n=1 Tax=Alicyclobacillus herbarius TaxID=122960 RepID=UPI0003FD3A35|nr:protein-glutamate O-methyltransferase CheR [Alicyclobacillus herbarius]
MDEFTAFMDTFRKQFGLDLSFYKRPQLERRVRSFQIRHQYPSLAALTRALTENRELQQQLIDKITIHVSDFFRNPERWQALWTWVESLFSGEPLRIWSTACATGEEAYTLAMLCEEHGRPYQIIATDVDERVLFAAEQGVYREHQLRALSDEQKNRFFTSQDRVRGVWRIRPELQQSVRFQHHDLLGPEVPDEAPFHLIVCRNVLIYFTEEGKQQVIAKLARALVPGGILFVGSTEQFLNSRRFGLVNIAPFLYQRGSD